MPVAYQLTLTLDRAATDKLAGDVAFKEVTTVTRRVLNRGTVLTPVRFGNLRAHNQMRVKRSGNDSTGEVWNDTSYAEAVHNGSREHVIRPVRKKALRFVVGGEVVFAKKVTIPGRKGRPFLYRALKEVAAARGYRIVPGGSR